MTPDEIIEILQAFKAGKKLERRYKSEVAPHAQWHDIAKVPDWNFSSYEYRVAPPANYVVTGILVLDESLTACARLRVSEHWEKDNVRFEFDGATKQLIKVEVLK